MSRLLRKIVKNKYVIIGNVFLVVGVFLFLYAFETQNSLMYFSSSFVSIVFSLYAFWNAKSRKPRPVNKEHFMAVNSYRKELIIGLFFVLLGIVFIILGYIYSNSFFDKTSILILYSLIFIFISVGVFDILIWVSKRKKKSPTHIDRKINSFNEKIHNILKEEREASFLRKFYIELFAIDIIFTIVGILSSIIFLLVKVDELFIGFFISLILIMLGIFFTFIKKYAKKKDIKLHYVNFKKHFFLLGLAMFFEATGIAFLGTFIVFKQAYIFSVIFLVFAVLAISAGILFTFIWYSKTKKNKVE